MEKNDVIAWLRQQPDKTFFEVVYGSATERGPDDYDRAWRESHVVIGYAVREKGNNAPSNPWSLELVALPRNEVGGQGDDNAMLSQAVATAATRSLVGRKRFVALCVAKKRTPPESDLVAHGGRREHEPPRLKRGR